MECYACRNSVAMALVTVHVVPEILRELVDAINRGGMTNPEGKRVSVAVVDAGADNHVLLKFTQHEER